MKLNTHPPKYGSRIKLAGVPAVHAERPHAAFGAPRIQHRADFAGPLAHQRRLAETGGSPPTTSLAGERQLR
jgi:hypothetical protein